MFHRAILVLLAVLVTGCSTFTSYPRVTRKARYAFENGDFEVSLREYGEGLDDHRDGVCYRLESGLVAQTGGMYRDSIRFFNSAEKRIGEFRQRAVVSATDLGEKTGALLLNDKTIPYKGEFFEQALLHSYQAMNYLFLGEAEGAGVEIRRASLAQKDAEREYQQEIEKSRREVNEHYELTQNIRNELEANYRIPEEYLRDNSNVYELGCTYYLGSLVYEMMGDYNDAYVDLKRLHRINPNFNYAVQDLYYNAKRAGFSDEAAEWKAKLPGDVPQLTRDMGSIVVLFQCDRGPQKREFSFVVPTGVGFQKIAWPVYFAAPEVASHLNVRIGERIYSTIPVTDINSVAIRYHRDKSLAMAARMAVRLAAKIASQYAAKAVGDEQGQGVGLLFSVLTSIGTSITEQADERCWMTLPRNIQFARAYLPAGEYNIALGLQSYSGTMNTQYLEKVQVVPGKTTFVLARSIDSRLFCDVNRKILRSR